MKIIIGGDPLNVLKYSGPSVTQIGKQAHFIDFYSFCCTAILSEKMFEGDSISQKKYG